MLLAFLVVTVLDLCYGAVGCDCVGPSLRRCQVATALDLTVLLVVTALDLRYGFGTALDLRYCWW